MVVMLGRPTDEQGQEIGLFDDFPVPRAVMLNLPEEACACLLVFHYRHRNMLCRRPGAGIAAGHPLGAPVDQMRHTKLWQAVRPPL
ncbi:hypothetical protein D3C77_371360 [compost metagenome]